MRNFASFFLVVIAGYKTASAQNLLPVFEDTLNESSVIDVSSMNYYSSNRFNNAMLDKFLFGGFIDEDLKNSNLERLKGINCIGAEAEQRIDSYTPTIHPFKKEKYGLMLSFSDNHFLSSTLPTDAYKLAMYGNASSVGDTLDLKFAHARYQHYQKLSFGFYDKKTLSSIQLSFVTGSKAFEFYTANSFFYTHPALDSIELNLQGQGFSTERFNPYLAFQGSGFSLDISYNFIFSSRQGKDQIVNFRIGNLGAIFWNQKSADYFVDSLTTYTGFDIHDFLGKDSTTRTWNFEDTLGIVKTTKRYTDVLPVELSIDKMADLRGPKLQAIFGFKAILTQDYRPYFYGGLFYRPIDSFWTSTYLSYGGFARLRWGVYATYRPVEKCTISIGTADLIGIISKNFGFGRSANLRVTFKL